MHPHIIHAHARQALNTHFQVIRQSGFILLPLQLRFGLQQLFIFLLSSHIAFGLRSILFIETFALHRCSPTHDSVGHRVRFGLQRIVGGAHR